MGSNPACAGEKRPSSERHWQGVWADLSVRPSGTEDIYKIYAESFSGADHLRRILEEAHTIVNDALAAATQRSGLASNT
jgi:phosphoglucomutase